MPRTRRPVVVWAPILPTRRFRTGTWSREAMQGGTKLVVIDPVYTQIASKADRWIPIRPGSDAC